ncbi:ribonuclease Y [Patescibacteria group bacterium]|nr:ribonuclease Y [Patescibacteria group bacterium]MBU1890996.1 ribonuclease Y [Patescibacteria group bacterium]
MSVTIWIVLVAAGLVCGGAFGYLIHKILISKKADSAEAKAQEIIRQAQNKQKEILLSAKDKAIKIIDDAKKEEARRHQEITRLQERLEKREGMFDQKLMELETRQQKLYERAQRIDSVKKEIEKIRSDQTAKLEKISSMNKEEAKEHLLSLTENNIKEDLVQRIKKLKQAGNEEIDKEAKNLLSVAIQRCASSHAAENTTTTVALPSDEMKGRIIGREGRNIRVIEQMTGVEIIVDDTPEVIVVSGFSPIRRHLAKRTLDKLILDGRIHPSRIEEAVEQSKKELAKDIKESGEEAAYEAGVAGLDPKLVQLLGRLKYRTSYGQNVLRHSIEVAHLSGLLAEELGANVPVAKKGGLLHDIGKAVDHEVQGGHPKIGYDIMKKFRIPEEVAYIAKAHHEDAPETLEGIVVKVADAISGARFGARKDSYENYLQRLTELEGVANTFPGVDKSYAIQAGREIRVFVKPEEIDDLNAERLARDIANRIEEELRYPGEIKVNLIREKRITEYAR